MKWVTIALYVLHKIIIINCIFLGRDFGLEPGLFSDIEDFVQDLEIVRSQLGSGSNVRGDSKGPAKKHGPGFKPNKKRTVNNSSTHNIDYPMQGDQGRRPYMPQKPLPRKMERFLMRIYNDLETDNRDGIKFFPDSLIPKLQEGLKLLKTRFRKPPLDVFSLKEKVHSALKEMFMKEELTERYYLFNYLCL